MPKIVGQQAAALDQQDRQQQQQQDTDTSASQSSSSNQASQAQDASEQAAPQQQQQQEQEQEQPAGSLQESLEGLGVSEEFAAAVDAALKLDDETLRAVSRTIMGRLDIVDLVGKNTAYEVAERVSLTEDC